MAVYTFYLCNLDGGASSFEAFDLGSDVEAPERALKMLKDHASCTYVAVWDDQRPVLESYRGGNARQGDAEPTSPAVPRASEVEHPAANGVASHRM